jgi:uncharacterized paraquat-inducible protein A
VKKVGTSTSTSTIVLVLELVLVLVPLVLVLVPLVLVLVELVVVFINAELELYFTLQNWLFLEVSTLVGKMFNFSENGRIDQEDQL